MCGKCGNLYIATKSLVTMFLDVITRAQSYMESYIDIITFVALLINTGALIFVIIQTCMTRQSVILTKQSIDDAKTQRQLEVLPKFRWIIQVRTSLETWGKDLQKRINVLKDGIREKNDKKLIMASHTKIKGPEDLSLSKYSYENMPSWLGELWVSGAQYYYNAIAPLASMCNGDKPNYAFAESWVNERGNDSLRAILQLMKYFDDMVPVVILNMPASISDDKFFG
jgi:hypothetical protein